MKPIINRLVAILFGAALLPACYSSHHSTYMPPPGGAGSPGMFTMSTPANGATNVPTSTSYAWSGANSASSYTLEVALDVGFTNEVVHEAGIMTTIFMPSSHLASGTV